MATMRLLTGDEFCTNSDITAYTTSVVPTPRHEASNALVAMAACASLACCITCVHADVWLMLQRRSTRGTCSTPRPQNHLDQFLSRLPTALRRFGIAKVVAQKLLFPRLLLSSGKQL